MNEDQRGRDDLILHSFFVMLLLELDNYKTIFHDSLTLVILSFLIMICGSIVSSFNITVICPNLCSPSDGQYCSHLICINIL